MTEMIKEKFFLKHFSFARYATDVNFQMCNRRSGNMQEGKKYFSGKQKLYGYKIEVSVLPNGLDLECTEHFKGSVSDLEIFKEHHDFHKANLKKARSERESKDLGFGAGDYPTQRALLADKGYQGGAEIVRLIRPKKQLPNAGLSVDNERFNRNISSDRTIVENYGRACGFWNVMSSKRK